MSFLTVEDVNSTIQRYGQEVYYHEVNTSDITDSTVDYFNIKYDFVIASRENKGNGSYEFKFQIVNDMFRQKYYALTLDGDVISNITHDASTNTMTVVTSELNIIFGVLLTEYIIDDQTLTWGKLDGKIKSGFEYHTTLDRIIYPAEVEVENFETGLKYVYTSEGVGLHYLIDGSEVYGWVMRVLDKTDFKFNCNSSLILGVVNTVRLGTDNRYKPSGSMVGNYTPRITVSYGNKIIPVEWNAGLNDYVFELDLTEKTNPSKIRFNVLVDSNKVINQSETLVTLDCNYKVVSTFADLESACGHNGISLIQLGADITFTDRISVEHSIKIVGDDNTLNLNGYGFDLGEEITFNGEHLVFNNGDTAIKQARNTTLKLTDCMFNECVSTEYNGMGACILCDINYPSLSIIDDFMTTLTGCLFYNNQSNILHGGQLNINQCKFHNTDVNVVDSSDTAFVYQVDGDCTFIECVFDIDYADDYSLCSGEKNIGYAQTIFKCGETARINNVPYNDLKEYNFDTFFTGSQNNRSHIFAKYYYPQITDCVFVSPTPNNEDKSFCYSLSGDDSLYKVNTQITRSSSGTENTNRIIIWE